MNGEDEKRRFFVKEEFIEWWAESFAEALKRHTAKIEWLQRREIKLDEAKDAWPVNMIPPEGFDSGNYIKVLSLDGAATLRLDTLGAHEFDLSEWTECKLLFHQVLITNTAQPGKKLILALGRGDFWTPEAPQKVERGASAELVICLNGPSTVGTDVASWYVQHAYEIMRVSLYSKNAPTGASLIVDSNVNGTTIFTDQSKRSQIAIGEHSADSDRPDIKLISVGDKMTFDIDQVGSIVAGGNPLMITVVLVKR